MSYIKLLVVTFLVITALIWCFVEPGFPSLIALLAALTSIPCIGAGTIKKILKQKQVVKGDGISIQAGGNVYNNTRDKSDDF